MIGSLLFIIIYSVLSSLSEKHFITWKINNSLEKSYLLMEFNQEYLMKFLQDGTLTQKDLLEFYMAEEVRDKYKVIEAEILKE